MDAIILSVKHDYYLKLGQKKNYQKTYHKVFADLNY